MGYCVAQADLFFGFKVDETLYNHDEIEEILKNYPDLEIIYAMMGGDDHQIFIAAKESHFESGDMKLIEFDLNKQHFSTVNHAIKLRDLIKEKLLKITYKNELLSWKLISSAWLST